METRLFQVRDLIDRANHAYYNTGTALLADPTFDALRDELRLLAPDDVRLGRVGAPILRDSLRTKCRHSIPMGSQSKVETREGFEKWVAGLGLDAGGYFHVNFKVDGSSVSLEYVNGHLFKAVTRGEGTEGEDITANALLFAGLPCGAMLDGELFNGFVRAEVYLAVDDWKMLDPEMTSNPRNYSAGICGRKDGSDSQYLRLMAFKAYRNSGDEIATTEAGVEEALKGMGFDVPQSAVGTADAVWGFYESTLAGRKGLSHWIDGLVVKIDDIATQARFGVSSGCPNGQLALKFPAEGAVTVLRSVEVTVGHTGAVCPTAKFDSISLGGANVASATLHNYDEICALDIAIGDRILVEKRGDIIPGIVAVIERPECRRAIETPSCCPACGGSLERRTLVSGGESAHLYCINEECPSRVIGKIGRWIDSLKILGVGDEFLSAMVAQLGMRNAADLYRLHEMESELAAVEVASGVRIGAKRAAKIIAAIENKRQLTIDEFIGSVGVDSLGKRRSTLIRRELPGQMDTVEDWLSGKLPGLVRLSQAEKKGKKVDEAQADSATYADRLSSEFMKKRDLVDSLLAAGVRVKTAEPVQAVAEGAPSFCFTGALTQSRSHYAKQVTARGWVVKDAVSAGLTYLVIADPGSSSSKAVKARTLGTKCIGEVELAALLA